MTEEGLHRLLCIKVLVEYIRVEVSSYSLPSPAADKLISDIDLIPGRCRALFAADAAVRASGRKRKKAARVDGHR